MTEAAYIDTRYGAPGVFGAPGVDLDSAGYALWLLEQYQHGLMSGVHEQFPVGVRQRLTVIVFAHLHDGARIVALVWP